MLPPGPRRPSIFQVWAYVQRPLSLLDACARRFGKRFTLRLGGGRAFVVTADPEDARAVFTGPPDVYSGKGNERFKAFVGERSLFVLEGKDHERHRRLLSPPFRGERMRAYGPLVLELARQRVERWPRGRAFPLVPELHAITLRVIFEAIFGVADPERTERLVALVTAVTSRASAAVLFVPALQVNLGPWSPWARFLRARDELDAIVYDEIRKARAAPAGREDVLAQLTGEPLSDQELRDELLTLLGAGHETTTAGLAWAFQWVLASPAVRERAHAELRGAIGTGALEASHLPDLRWIEACANEALRLSPPVPIVPRKLERPATLGGFELEAGTYVAPSPYLVQRDPAVFPDPLRFDPERFVGKRPGPFEHFPFGGGSRLCIGLPFAIFEMKAILAAVLAAAPGLELAGAPSFASRRKGIVVAPRDGTRVVLPRRG